MSHNDFILPISFNTAQKIGLEESVLLAFLQQQAFLLTTNVLRLELSVLSSQLPFWTPPVLLRTLSSLQSCQALHFERVANKVVIHLPEGDSLHGGNNTAQNTGFNSANAETGNTQQRRDSPLLDKVSRLQKEHSNASAQPKVNGAKHRNTVQAQSAVRMDNNQSVMVPTVAPIFESNVESNVESSVPATWPRASESKTDSRRGVSDFDLYLEQQERTRQPDQWQPEEATLEQITQAGIPREFALHLQTEFLLRIKEQRKNVRTWNSEFFKYVKRQWQYKQADRSSYEGTQSSTNHSRTSKEQVSDALSNIHDTDW